MSKSIVIIEPVGGNGGMGFYNHQLSTSLNKAGWMVSLCTGNSSERSHGKYHVYNVFNDVFGSGFIIKRAIKYFLGALYSYRVVLLSKSSIVHFHFFRVGLKEAFLVALAKILRKKVVITAHDVGSFRNNDDVYLALKYVYSQASSIITHSAVATSTLSELNPSWGKKISRIPHGNYIGYLNNKLDTHTNPLINENKDEFRILLFGKLKRIKRIDIAIKALGYLKRKKNHAVKLIIAGKPYDIEEAELSQLIKDEGVEDNVSLILRYISDDELNSLFLRSHVSLLPYDLIFQSGVLLLCMSYRVPVIVSNIEGMTDVITDNVNGSVFNAGNYHDLAHKIEQLIEQPQKLAEITNNAYMEVKQNNSWDFCGELTAQVYSKLVNE